MPVSLIGLGCGPGARTVGNARRPGKHVFVRALHREAVTCVGSHRLSAVEQMSQACQQGVTALPALSPALAASLATR